MEKNCLEIPERFVDRGDFLYEFQINGALYISWAMWCDIIQNQARHWNY